MPGQLKTSAVCPVCVKPIVAVFRQWKAGGGVKAEFMHEPSGTPPTFAHAKHFTEAEYQRWSDANEVHS